MEYGKIESKAVSLRDDAHHSASYRLHQFEKFSEEMNLDLIRPEKSTIGAKWMIGEQYFLEG